jgi:hypothetical protein
MSKTLLSVSLIKRLAEWVALAACMAVLLIEGAAEDFGPVAVKQSALASTPEKTHVIVVGFMGGFVHRDDPQHPEVRLIRELRQEYPTGAYFCLFENSNVDEAYQTIIRELNVPDSDPVSENKARYARILLFGHSWGASAVVRLARKLDRASLGTAGCPRLMQIWRSRGHSGRNQFAFQRDTIPKPSA